MTKAGREVMEIFEAFDLTGTAWSAAQLAGCDAKTVARYVAVRQAGGDPLAKMSRPRLIDGFMDKVEELVKTITADHGPCTVLVNNAGIVGNPLMETTLSEWDRVLAVNATAPFLLIREVGRLMIAAGGGSIVNISSSSAFRAAMSGGAYAASKAALGALTRAAAWELGPSNVNVNTVAPGVTRTPITAAAFGDAEALDAAVRSGPLANLLQRVSEPQDVANVVAFLCLPASRQVTGQVIHTSAGAIVPA